MRSAAAFSRSPIKRLILRCSSKRTVRWPTFFGYWGFRGSLEHSERGLALYALNECRPSGEEHMRAACLFFASLCTAALGFRTKGYSGRWSS